MNDSLHLEDPKRPLLTRLLGFPLFRAIKSSPPKNVVRAYVSAVSVFFAPEVSQEIFLLFRLQLG